LVRKFARAGVTSLPIFSSQDQGQCT